MARSKKGILVLVVVLVVVVAVWAIVMARQKKRVTSVGAESPPTKTSPVLSPVAVEMTPFASTNTYTALEEEDLKVKANVPSYTLKPDLSNLSNLRIFKKILDAKQADVIARSGFVVSPTNYIQMFQVYENNEYQRPLKIPAFITTDSMLHTYHIFYDYTLRQVESNKLYDIAVKLTDAMLAASQKDLAEVKDDMVKDAARRNVAYFAVARKLLKGTDPPSEVADMANADLGKIEDHKGKAVSTILGYNLEFSQFVPRGHYTRSEKLKKYFRAMMLYGLAPFPIPQGKIGPRATVQALLIVRDLRTSSIGGVSALELWETIYKPTAFYVGTADDYTVSQYSALMDTVYGKSPSPDGFGDKAKLDTFVRDVKKLPGPGIENYVAISKKNWVPDPMSPVGRQFRFMGQRFIPDSRVMQELTHPKADGRNFPKGLDVLAAMGSDRALEILEKIYSVNRFSGYKNQMTKMRKDMAETPRSTWQSNLYYGWLWSLQSVAKPAPGGYPAFMRNQASVDKSLFTALGSWTELRHDTILYAKQSVAECGGDGEEIPTPKGYVEPNLEFWSKLKWLNEYTEAGLSSRGLITEEVKDRFKQLGDWIDFFRRITIKELTGKKVTEEEYQQMETYGAALEALMLNFAGGDIISDADKDMALVADVHTSFDNVLEEGTGRAAAIYVVVPIEGKLYLTRGATYTQYEFMWPSADRLTDEKWQQMLKTNKEPGFAEWVKSFLLESKKKPVPEFENYFGGC